MLKLSFAELLTCMGVRMPKTRPNKTQQLSNQCTPCKQGPYLVGEV